MSDEINLSEHVCEVCGSQPTKAHYVVQQMIELKGAWYAPGAMHYYCDAHGPQPLLTVDYGGTR